MIPYLRAADPQGEASWRFTMYKTISMAVLAAQTILSIGCLGGGDASASNAADTLTRRHKDEIISTR